MNTMLSRLLVPVLAVAAVVVGWIAYDTNRAIRNSYAQWWAADMVAKHLEANDNKWPRSWDELRDDYEACVAKSGQPWTFDEIQRRVIIDFNVQTDSLIEISRETNEPDLNVIRAADGTKYNWQEREPNTIIFNYLTGQSEQRPIRTGFGGSAG